MTRKPPPPPDNRSVQQLAQELASEVQATAPYLPPDQYHRLSVIATNLQARCGACPARRA